MSFFNGLENSLSLYLPAVYIACGIALFLCFILAWKVGVKEIYLSAFFLFASVACLATFVADTATGGDTAVVAFLSCALFGFTYPVLCGVIFRARVCRKKRLEKEQAARLEKYVLPDRQNTFVKERLQTALCARPQETFPTEQAFRLSYVRRTLTKLKSAPLSPADRVETERISTTLTQRCFQENLTAEQLRSVNDCFARVLKLAAKYAV